MRQFIRRNRAIHLWLGCALLAVALFHLTKGLKSWMNLWVDWVTTPLKGSLAAIAYLFPFSLAEVLVCLLVWAAVYLLVREIRKIRRGASLPEGLYRIVCGAAAILLSYYGGYCLLFGANYYADTFQDKSGIYAQAATVDDLYRVTEFFALGLAETSTQVARDEDGVFAVTWPEIAEESVDIYRNLEEIYPFLTYRDRPPKALLCSPIMRYTDYTGFYFPFTAEANLNVMTPGCHIPATVIHEMAHQRGVASEDEANFVAILACTVSDNPTFAYSGYLMGYNYLANSLYLEDPALYAQVRELLTDEVRADMANVSSYHADKLNLAVEVTNVIYDNVLKSYGNTSGIKSYGEVVDLLIAYY